MIGSSRIRRSGLRLFLLLGLLPVAAGAQTLDEVLAKHAAAHGGLEAWRAVQSLAITGTAVTFSNAGPFVYEWRRPDSFRFEQTVLKQKVVYAHHGTATWWLQPLYGVEKPAAVSDQPQAALLRKSVTFDSPLVDAAAKGNKVELLGREEIDGQPAWKLAVSLKDGSGETWYLDPSTGLELARLDSTLDPPGVEERWTYYSDFRTTEGLVIAHRQDQEFGIRHVALTVEKVQINPGIAPDRFEMK